MARSNACMTLPSCMMPDGGQACSEYADTIESNRKMLMALEVARVAVTELPVLSATDIEIKLLCLAKITWAIGESK